MFKSTITSVSQMLSVTENCLDFVLNSERRATCRLSCGNKDWDISFYRDEVGIMNGGRGRMENNVYI